MHAPFLKLTLVSTLVWFSKALTLPTELSEITGLSERQIRRLLDTRSTTVTTSSAPHSTCAEANTTVVFPKPTLPSAYDIAKRNAFVKR